MDLKNRIYSTVGGVDHEDLRCNQLEAGFNYTPCSIFFPPVWPDMAIVNGPSFWLMYLLKLLIFHSYVNVYQRVSTEEPEAKLSCWKELA